MAHETLCIQAELSKISCCGSDSWIFPYLLDKMFSFLNPYWPHMVKKYIRFLEVDSCHYQVKPKKAWGFVAYLQRITGESISKSILEVLKTHGIDIKSCRGQAYDTTSSMSSITAGVQAHIKKEAPDADYQGCSLNLVICKASAITSVRNMFDSCQQAFLFFHNSPKRQRFCYWIILSRTNKKED